MPLDKEYRKGMFLTGEDVPNHFGFRFARKRTSDQTLADVSFLLH